MDETSWNPVVGCRKVGPGCERCWAAAFAERWKGMRGHLFEHGFELRVVAEALAEPLRWQERRRVAVARMGDLFAEGVPDGWIEAVCRVMELAPWHRFEVTTKRAKRMRALLGGRLKAFGKLPHVWWGVSVEDREHLWRLKELRAAPVANRMLLAEPLLEDLGRLDLRGVGWVIAGGETGGGARPMDEAWAIAILDRCRKEKVPFLFKQRGGATVASGGRELKGRVHDAGPPMPKTPVTSRSERRGSIAEAEALAAKWAGAEVVTLRRRAG